MDESVFDSLELLRFRVGNLGFGVDSRRTESGIDRKRRRIEIRPPKRLTSPIRLVIVIPSVATRPFRLLTLVQISRNTRLKPSANLRNIMNISLEFIFLYLGFSGIKDALNLGLKFF